MTMTDTALSLTGDFTNPAIEISPTFTQKRDAAIAAASLVPAILKTEADVKLAKRRYDEAKAIAKEVKETRLSLSRPITKLNKYLIEKEREFLEELEKTMDQLEGGVNNYQRRQREEQEAARLAAERAQKEAAALAEKARVELENAKAMPTATPEDIEDAEMASLKAQLDATPLPVVAVAHVRGVSAREVLDFEVTNVRSFSLLFPHLCNIEVRRADVLRELNKGNAFHPNTPENPKPEDWIPEVPGLRVFKDLKTSLR